MSAATPLPVVSRIDPQNPPLSTAQKVTKAFLLVAAVAAAVAVLAIVVLFFPPALGALAPLASYAIYVLAAAVFVVGIALTAAAISAIVHKVKKIDEEIEAHENTAIALGNIGNGLGNLAQFTTNALNAFEAASAAAPPASSAPVSVPAPAPAPDIPPAPNLPVRPMPSTHLKRPVFAAAILSPVPVSASDSIFANTSSSGDMGSRSASPIPTPPSSTSPLGVASEDPSPISAAAAAAYSLPTTATVAADDAFAASVMQSADGGPSPIISQRPLFFTDSTPTELALQIAVIERLLTVAIESLNKNRCNVENIRLPKCDEPELQLKAVTSEYTRLLEALKRNPRNPNIHRVCYDLYTGVSLLASNQRLRQHLGIPPNFDSSKPMSDQLRSAFEKMQPSAALGSSVASTTYKSILDHFSINFDALGSFNPPHKMATLQIEGNEVTILGFGSPTIQNWHGGDTRIHPIFLGYLAEMEKRGEKHLYMSFQDERTPKFLTAEKERSRVLREANSSSFIVVVCSKNSHFYHSSASTSVVAFKGELYNQFFTLEVGVSGCSLPENLKNSPEFQEWARLAISQICTHYGISDTSLISVDRKLIIETFYSILALKIAKDKKVSRINLTCKDDIDRGVNAFGNKIQLIQTSNNLHNSQESYDLFTHALLRSVHVRKRAIIEHRLVDFTDLMSRMNSARGNIVQELVGRVGNLTLV